MSIPKAASLVITLAGGLAHAFVALQLAATYATMRSIEAETEYDGAWRLDGLRILYALLELYLFAGALVSFVGLYGVVRGKPVHVRLYRDCATADLLFTALLGVAAGVSAWGSNSTTTLSCDSPELAPLLPLIGALLAPFLPAPLSPDEACERYLAHLGAGIAAALLVLSLVRVHFLLAVNAHYHALLKDEERARRHDDFATHNANDGVQRIRLLPLPAGISAHDVVYAPVHVPAAAMHGAETWVRVPSASSSSALTPPSSPPAPSYAPAYVNTQRESRQAEDEEPSLDAGLLDVSVVRTKREWI
ncbi:hypothetical protein HMN09_00847800 [Mycena chlorophos]|uniref:Uncharacterized protein n=1 Tax=Mycena chlorophos TaxID=658473 RepID=A0A8H6W6A4_MYCCL|nr:hypothetical protein HMN09_00847800 [Mycena chlorophos]